VGNVWERHRNCAARERLPPSPALLTNALFRVVAPGRSFLPGTEPQIEIVAWAVTRSEPSSEPWQHLGDLDGLRKELARWKG